METNLTEQELSEITMGYNWNRNMSYEEFLQKNQELNLFGSFDLFNKIELNYLTYIYENDK